MPFSLLSNYVDQKNKATSAGCNQATGGDPRVAGTGAGPRALLLTRPLSLCRSFRFYTPVIRFLSFSGGTAILGTVAPPESTSCLQYKLLPQLDEEGEGRFVISLSTDNFHMLLICPRKHEPTGDIPAPQQTEWHLESLESSGGLWGQAAPAAVLSGNGSWAPKIARVNRFFCYHTKASSSFQA